ncbi:hypothetical protein SSP35_22_00750 [Streptomyces sp. NBRC 110611]|uniref:hypothetical protein n=1 Tax=Streptomyces sp. NBRC 110611 TaxID=1621259 RepID=UPI000832693D|nr:hypothetical protein [Streptomyces sp. NBRC 110611]GAU70771.1 hypothetical protein SSP35_22_00750 [Streptomyces sp. NBRC 110611]
MTDDENRATLFFYPPVDDADSWHMTFEGLEEALKERFPGALIQTLPTPFREGNFLSFEVLVAEGVGVRGTATIPIEECGCITLKLVTPGEAAPFAQWLRDDFIPSPDLIRFSSEGAMEIGDETHWELPRSGEQAGIEEDLRAHIAYVESI